MRPDELVAALAESPFFQGLAQEQRISLARQGRVVEHEPGTAVFAPGGSPSALVLVLEGLVEICRAPDGSSAVEPVAYMGPGSTLAESKVITGTRFTSLARFPEGGRTLQWPRPLVLRTLYSSRDFGMQYLHNLARRLEGTFATIARGTKLGGRLDHFDLPTILQTVAESGAVGTLEIRDARGAPFGAIAIADRLIGPLVCGRLRGPAAFFEILVTPPERGTFNFRSTAAPAETVDRYELHGLLFESARVQDEYRRFAGELDGGTTLQAASRQPEWQGEGDPHLVEQIWQAVAARPQGWAELAERLPYSRGQIALAVRDMLAVGLLVAAAAAAPPAAAG